MGQKIQRGEERLEPVQIHPVSPNQTRPSKGDIGKHPFAAVKALKLESTAHSPLTDLFSVEAGRVEVGKTAGESHEESCLFRTKETCYEEVAFFHGEPPI